MAEPVPYALPQQRELYGDAEVGTASQFQCSHQPSTMRYQNLPSVQKATEQSYLASKIKPQITKQYVNTLMQGRPDLSILEENYEYRDKFYEPQYSDVRTADVKFRETES